MIDTVVYEVACVYIIIIMTLFLKLKVVPFFFFLGLKRGMCSQINHFPEDADYDQDAAEYLLRELRAFVAPWCT